MIRRLVGYCSDIEGNLDYWRRYVALSSVLTRAPSSSELTLRDGCQFVFGGDICDRGPGDMRITQELLTLKDKYPDRVHLILG